MILWVAVTRDKYELPIAVADSCKELAEMVGVTANAIYILRNYAKKHRDYKCPYITVEVKQ